MTLLLESKAVDQRALRDEFNSCVQENLGQEPDETSPACHARWRDARFRFLSDYYKTLTGEELEPGDSAEDSVFEAWADRA